MYEQEIGKKLSYICRNGKRVICNSLSKYNISGAHQHYLRELIHHSPMSQDELARRLELERSTVARGLKKLEEDGFVLRSLHPDDKRKNLVTLTPKALAFAEDIKAGFKRNNEVRYATLTEEEKKQLNDLLGKVHDAIKERGGI